MTPTTEPKGHNDGTGGLCFGTRHLSSDGITFACPKCGAFWNPQESEPFGHNLDAAQED